METVEKSNEKTINRKFLSFTLSLLAGSIGMTIAFSVYGSMNWELSMGQWGTLNGIACFFIVRHYPFSAWYVWFTCNLMILVAGAIDQQFWIGDMYKEYVLIFVLTIIGVITGVIFRKRENHITTP